MRPPFSLVIRSLLIVLLDSFLYLLMLAVDANFRAKNLIRSSEAKDPGLHTGLAYFVENEGYREHLMKSVTQTDVSFPIMNFLLRDETLMSRADQHMQRVPDNGARGN